jgi:hypothetical protein
MPIERAYGMMAAAIGLPQRLSLITEGAQK